MVWISDFDYRTFYIVRLEYADAVERKIPIEVYRDLKEGRRLADPDMAPRHFRFYKSDRKTVPDIFQVENALVIVNERMHDLLHRFDLGATQFIEVTITRKGAAFPGRFFIMNVAEWKDGLIPERSNVEPCNVIRRGAIFRTWGIADPRMSVTAAAGEGTDIWRDRGLWQGVFVSDRLAEACRAAKIRPMKFYPVMVET